MATKTTRTDTTETSVTEAPLTRRPSVGGLSLNRVSMIGRIATNPVLRWRQLNGVAVTSFRLANNGTYGDRVPPDCSRGVGWPRSRPSTCRRVVYEIVQMLQVSSAAGPGPAMTAWSVTSPRSPPRTLSSFRLRPPAIRRRLSPRKARIIAPPTSRRLDEARATRASLLLLQRPLIDTQVPRAYICSYPLMRARQETVKVHTSHLCLASCLHLRIGPHSFRRVGSSDNQCCQTSGRTTACSCFVRITVPHSSR